jgi:hypothetical protein
MRIDRRTFLEYLGAATVTPIVAGQQEASGMYGLIVKITVVPGKRDEMIGILKESAAAMPGCLSYVVAKDSADENVTLGDRGVGQPGQSRRFSCIACCEERHASRQRARLELRENRCHNSSLGSWPSIIALLNQVNRVKV